MQTDRQEGHLHVGVWDSLIHQPLPAPAGPSPEEALGPQHTCCPGARTAQGYRRLPSQGEMAQILQVSGEYGRGC